MAKKELDEYQELLQAYLQVHDTYYKLMIATLRYSKRLRPALQQRYLPLEFRDRLLKFDEELRKFAAELADKFTALDVDIELLQKRQTEGRG